MVTVVVRRPARGAAPGMPSGELVLQAPPEIPVPAGRQWTQVLMVLPMVAIMGSSVVMFSGSSAGVLRMVVMGLFAVAMLGMVAAAFLNGGGPSKREMAQARRTYLRDLAQHRMRVARTARRQQEALWYLHPDPASLWSLVASRRLWERRREDEDFGVARVGLGRQGLATALVPPDTAPLEQLEPLSALALRRFITTYSAVPDLPLAMAVTGFARIHLDGDRERVAALVRALLAQLAALHPPDDLRIAVCASPQRREDWEWVKWLPHALHPERTDALGPLRLVAPAVTGLEAMLEDLLAKRPRFDPDRAAPVAGPHLVVVLDGGAVAGSDHLMTEGGVEGVTVLDLTGGSPWMPDRSVLVLEVGADGALRSRTTDDDAELGVADALPAVAAEALARQLAPLRLTGGVRGEQPMSAELGLADLLDLGDPYAFDPADTWVPRPSRDRLRVRFGIRPDGTPVELDLKESAQDGMGPHGLLIGATGSGKSELLRTLVLALAVTHPPNSLNFALVDFKGGATFARLDRLPHTSAVITNLADELPLVDRMTDALNGELIRRQELLRAAGDFSSLRDYEKARAAGAPLPEVPTLLVVCDEFSELLSARPDFIDVFVQIGRIGRALGVHLLLASQRLEEGRLRGLDTQLSYRIGLRTFSDVESRAVLGVPDAHRLPRAPGHGFLKFATEPMARFRSAYVSGVHRPVEVGASGPGEQEADGLAEYSTAYVAPPVVEEAEPDEVADDPDEAVGESLLDILVDRLAGRGTPAHQVWLPPLAEPVTLDQLLGTPVADPVHGLRAPGGKPLHAVVGELDRPLEQRRDPLVLDLSAAAGHAVVMGAPRTGKSTALRTLVTSLALTHSPWEVQFYCLDFGGGALAALRGLPHVGGVAARQDTGAVRRTVAEVASLLAERERRFAALGVDGMADHRARRAAGQITDDPHGDVFLVVDGWQTLRKEFEDLEDVITAIAGRGLAYGVHVVVTCSRWLDLRPALRDLFGSKLELRLGDPIDTAVDRASASSVPENAPGRGVVTSRHQALVALPRIDGVRSADDLTAGLTALVDAVAAAWPGERAPAVRLLPDHLPHTSLPSADEGLRFSVGVAEHDLSPVRLDFAADPHLLLLGDSDSGKTSFLRLLAHRITANRTPAEARLIIVDHRRSLLSEVTTEHVIGYGTDLTSTGNLMTEAADAMLERLPGPGVTPEQLRKRSWWQGPELFVLVDDYDLVAGGSTNPLLPLVDHLAQAGDIGLHVVVTRRTGGAARALYERFLARMRDVGTPGLLLSGDRDEGPLLGGVKAQQLPPGRGRLISRREPGGLVQLAWLPPAE
ncbi:type VII secretion protein EccC [Saccharothrix sp. ALI-22-I]|uniref:type VII secretion protein EccCa n=1 Tax=Saccharothrix sp. ALI-22-I TaxID=1933778 RepID=UPI00097BECF6|nr:type VII secretion protein EccCa [Saccharothrix sp. ALI-22-I]ONI92873.1 type VII secretion protein EccC [Saccharothrix sp. ALI-22-I]